MRLDTFPAIGTLGFAYYELVKRIKWISFLDYLGYNKSEVLEELERDFGFKRYPFKHYESIFSLFYQGYLLPKKFGVDKRRFHFATQIAFGQVTREAALHGIDGIPYPSEMAIEDDLLYFLKKWLKTPYYTMIFAYK